jgi:signal transduction histidine kinase
MKMTNRRGNRWDSLLGAAIANPVGFFFIFRWLTWFLALAIVLSRSAPEVTLRFQPGLLMYAALHLALGTWYSVMLHPRLANTPGALTRLKPPYDLVVAGVADILSSLALVYFSGGWGSPFWHFAVTAILVPCFLLSPLWGMVTVTGYAGAYVLVVAIAGGGLDSALVVGQRNVFMGNMVTAFLVAIAVSYLGVLFRALQAQRLRTRQALDETETLFLVTETVVQSGTDLEGLVSRVNQVVRTSGLFERFGVFLSDEDGRLQLASSIVGIEELGTEMAEKSARERHPITYTLPPETGWQTAAPLLAGDRMVGVMVAGDRREERESRKATDLVEAIASQIAIGIHNTILAQQQAELAAQEERRYIAREIHDGIAQSIYMLSLHLETCADLAARQRHELQERLEKLVALSKETLLEVRHYIFDLKPYLAGEKGMVSMVESQVREFDRVAAIPATLNAVGEERSVAVPIATCLYRVTQEALANAFKHAHGSRIVVHLEFLSDGVRLRVQDDGQGVDPATVVSGHGLQNMRRRSEELGGTFSLNSTPGSGTEVAIWLPC